MITITKKLFKKHTKRMRHAGKAGLIDDYKSAAAIASRILWDIAPEIATQLPDGDCSPRAFSKAWSEIKIEDESSDKNDDLSDAFDTMTSYNGG
jgi:hypothetical protein